MIRPLSADLRTESDRKHRGGQSPAFAGDSHAEVQGEHRSDRLVAEGKDSRSNRWIDRFEKRKSMKVGIAGVDTAEAMV